MNAAPVLLDLFVSTFPQTFFHDKSYIVPLKINIHHDISAELPYCDADDISSTLRFYTRSSGYLQSIVANQWRYDLSGKPVQRLLASDYRHAKINLNIHAIRRLIQNLNKQKRAGLDSFFTIQDLKKRASALRRYQRASRLYGRHGEVVHIQTAILQAHEAIAAIHPSHAKTVLVSRYYLYVNDGIRNLSYARFSDAKAKFREALLVAREQGYSGKLPQPNVFFDVAELQSHDSYIDAVESFREGQFGAASEHFEVWLNINHDKKGGLRYDTFRFFSLLCQLLVKSIHRKLTLSDWKGLEEYAATAYLTRQALAVLARLDVIRAMSLRRPTPTTQQLITEELLGIREGWQFLVAEVPVEGEDRKATMALPLRLPEFLNIYPYISSEDDLWRQVLSQNLRHCLLLKADYERRREDHRIRWSCTNDASPLLLSEGSQSEEIENLSNESLLDLIEESLKERHKTHWHWFCESRPLIAEFQKAVEDNNFHEAIAKQQQFLDHNRMLPHVIAVLSGDEIREGRYAQQLALEPSFSGTVARRMWASQPGTLILDAPQLPKKASYYYMRPGWNLRKTRRFATPSEPLLEAELPKWLITFYRNAIGRGKIPIPRERFVAWLEQMPETRRLIACRLLEGLHYFDEAKVRAGWKNLYRTKLPPEAKVKDVAYCGLGHTGKSSSLTLYFLTQALKTVPENERSFDFRMALQPLAQHANGGEAKPRAIVFVDDMIGTGQQAIKELGKILEDPRNEWIKGRAIYYCALVGFESAVQKIAEELAPIVDGVFVNKSLREEDRAFSSANPIWRSTEQCKAAKEWVENVGVGLVKENYEEPELHGLGWNGSEALIAFHYNTPNNTLPIFWSTGTVKGKAWVPLLARTE